MDDFCDKKNLVPKTSRSCNERPSSNGSTEQLGKSLTCENSGYPKSPPLQKKVYIREIDCLDHWTDNYVSCKIRDDEELGIIIHNSNGFIQQEDPNHVIISFDEIKDGKKYQHYYFGGRNL